MQIVGPKQVDGMLNRIKEMGPLRNGLHGVALTFAMLMPFARGPEYSATWDLFFGGILPALGPIVVILIGLDIMMSSIYRTDAEGDEVARLTLIIRAHWVIGALLLGAWLAVFLPVLL